MFCVRVRCHLVICSRFNYRIEKIKNKRYIVRMKIFIILVIDNNNFYRLITTIQLIWMYIKKADIRIYRRAMQTK